MELTKTTERARLMERLVRIEENIAVGERSDSLQRNHIAREEKRGQVTPAEQAALQEMEKTQAEQIAARDRLRQELGKFIVIDACSPQSR